jgi:hypothetical protein
MKTETFIKKVLASSSTTKAKILKLEVRAFKEIPQSLNQKSCIAAANQLKNQ